MAKITKFQKGQNRGTRTCSSCGKRTWESRVQDMGGNYFLCEDCYEEAGLENEHQDGHHRPEENGPNAACPMCKADTEAQKSATEVAISAAKSALQRRAGDPWDKAELDELKMLIGRLGTYKGCREFAEMNPARTAAGAMYQWSKMAR